MSMCDTCCLMHVQESQIATTLCVTFNLFLSYKAGTYYLLELEWMNGLMVLSEAGSFAKQLFNLQAQMKRFRMTSMPSMALVLLYGSSLEESRMVPNSSGNVEKLCMTYSTTGVSTTKRGGTESCRDNYSVSYVACLREKYRKSHLSTEPSGLMLASWRISPYLTPCSASSPAGV